MDNIYKNIEEYNPNKNRKILTMFDDMIAAMLSNKKLNLIVTELFIRVRKLNISFVFITQSYSTVPKAIRLNLTICFIMKIPNKRELQQIAFNDSYIYFYIESLWKIYNKTIFVFNDWHYSCIR